MAQTIGGFQPIPNVQDPYVKEIGEFAVAEHNKQAGQALVFVRVVSGQQQVVAGTNYKLVIEAEDARGARKEYEAAVYDRPWDKVRTLTSFSPMAQKVGGFQPIPDVEDPYVKEIGEFAVAEHNKQAGQALVFVRVVSGQQQVVAGTNYKLVIEAKDARGARKEYEAAVYDRPWDKVRTLTSFSSMAQKVGGFQPIPDVEDPYVKEIGEFAVAEHNKQAGQALVFVRVVSGQQQVVAGTNYKLVIEAEDRRGARKQYEAVVYDRAWDKVRTLTSFKSLPAKRFKFWATPACCGRA